MEKLVFDEEVIHSYLMQDIICVGIRGQAECCDECRMDGTARAGFLPESGYAITIAHIFVFRNDILRIAVFDFA